MWRRTTCGPEKNTLIALLLFAPAKSEQLIGNKLLRFTSYNTCAYAQNWSEKFTVC